MQQPIFFFLFDFLVRHFLQKLFGDLDGVCCSAFADVVRNDPDVQSVLNGEVASDSADIYLVSACSVAGKRVYVVLYVILYDDARGCTGSSMRP